MIVDDFDIHCTLVRPAKTHAPLIVDADAELTSPVTTQRSEPMGRWDGEIGQRHCCNHSLQPHSCPTLNLGRQTTDRLAVEESLRVSTLESLHQLFMITPLINIVEQKYLMRMI